MALRAAGGDSRAVAKSAEDGLGVLHNLEFGAVRLAFTDALDATGKRNPVTENLSFRVGARHSDVLANRRRLSQRLGIPYSWHEVLQEHGADVVEIKGSDFRPAPLIDGVDDRDQELRNSEPRGDAIITSVPNCPVVIFTADCVPVALGVTDPPAVAVVHAGWKGLMAGVVENASRQLTEKFRQPDWVVAGPSIGPCCYAVDDKRLVAFQERFGHGAVDIANKSLNLQAAVVEALEKTGKLPGVVLQLGPCTSCSESLFSFRRDGSETGRQALVAWIRQQD